MQTNLLMIQLLARVYWFDEALQAALRKAGWPPISRVQSLLFANLATGEHRPTRLAANLGVSRQAISQMINELVERGILKVDVDPNDGRARIVKFAEAAHPLRHAASTVLRELEDELRTRIGDQKVRAMQTGLSSDWGLAPIVRLVPVPEAERSSAKVAKGQRGRKRRAGEKLSRA